MNTLAEALAPLSGFSVDLDAGILATTPTIRARPML